jgi:hypothetical protein
MFEKERNEIADIDSVLPPHPDLAKVEELVRAARLRQLDRY